MRIILLVLLGACALVTSPVARAADALASENPVHSELRAVRDGLLAGMNKGDIDGQLGYLHPNVVVTWHNAQVSRGREGVRTYLQKMLNGPEKVVAQYGAKVNVDELSILYGETALAFGSADEHFTMTNGLSIDLTARWTATLARADGRWLVTSIHISDNLFDNALLKRAKSLVPWVAVISLLFGLIGGFFAGRRGRPIVTPPSNERAGV